MVKLGSQRQGIPKKIEGEKKQENIWRNKQKE